MIIKQMHLKYLILKDFLKALYFYFIKILKSGNLQQKQLIQEFGII